MYLQCERLFDDNFEYLWHLFEYLKVPDVVACCIFMQYVINSYKGEHFSAYFVCITALFLVWNCSEFQPMIIQKFHRLGSV